MIAPWLTYCLLSSLLLGSAAWLVEFALRLYRRPVRWVWAVAMLGSLALPVAALLSPSGVSFSEQPLLPLRDAPIVGALLTLQPADDAAGSAWLSGRIDPLLVAWLLSSLAVLAFYLRSCRRLRGERKGWSQRAIGGRKVLLSSGIGPAVVGFFRSLIVVPAWVLDLDEELRRMIFLHEEEHLRAWDHRLLHAAWLVLAATPWNLPLWWQWRRLRLAVELDCDGRVLDAGVNRRAYGELLLEVGRRSSGLTYLPAAFSEPRSMLERRVKDMVRRVPRFRREKGILAAIVAAGLLAFACEAPTPTDNSTVTPPVVPSKVMTGVITDAVTGEPLAGVQVYLEKTGRGALTAENGRFFLLNLPPGVYRLVAEHPDYEPFTAELRLTQDGVAVSSSEFELSAETIELRIQLEPLTQDVSARPVFTPYTKVPQLRNRDAAVRAVERNYPKLLKDAGIGGQVVVWVFIDTAGIVKNTSVQSSSGRRELDLAAVRTVQEFEFVPAENRGRPVPVWLQIPIVFSAER
jgi:TonB family protein